MIDIAVAILVLGALSSISSVTIFLSMGIVQSVVKNRRAKNAGRKETFEYLVSDDISNGREQNKLPAISYKKNDRAPQDYHYVTEFVQYEPIDLDSSLRIMSSCDCTDDCRDEREACACSRTSKGGFVYSPSGRLSSDYSIEAPDMIRECNQACKCNRKKCRNMVIQRGAQGQFVLFRTKSRGWGVRTLADLKRGTFIGIYSGELISAEQTSLRQDDTYLFNLARSQQVVKKQDSSEENREQEESGEAIETEGEVLNEGNEENGRENYEVVTTHEYLEPIGTDSSSIAETISSGYAQSCDNNGGEAYLDHPTEGCDLSVEQTDGSNGCNLTATESVGEREVTRETVETQLPEVVEEAHSQKGDPREEEGDSSKKESSYICDAKYYGNFTRFINHSCKPNVTGIKTFTTHQDVRFPYIAFFSNRDIRANEELTLNYGDNYWLVKCTRDKIYCLCNQENCRFTKKTLPNTLAQYKSS